VNPGESTFIFVAVALKAAGTLLHDTETNILEVPFHTNLEEEPVPVPKERVFTVFATGRKPSFANVPL
jgi:hypothetical protein